MCVGVDPNESVVASSHVVSAWVNEGATRQQVMCESTGALGSGHMFHHIRTIRSLRLAVGTAVVLSGCGGSDSTAPLNDMSATSAAALAAMSEGLQDEYRAADAYEAVLAQFGQVLPFRNILQAEQQHAASLASLFTTRGWPVPAREERASVPSFASVRDACAVGAAAEVDNIALYDRLLALELPLDVRRVFEANRRASLVNHLPAFERCGPVIVGVR